MSSKKCPKCGQMTLWTVSGVTISPQERDDFEKCYNCGFIQRVRR